MVRPICCSNTRGAPIPATTDPSAAPAAADPSELDQLQTQLGYRFARPQLLQRALTHRSYSSVHNERLEFLGDAVLGLAVAHFLFAALGDHTEGDLSRMRANLVREESLHQMALALGLPKLLRLGAGAQRSGGRTRPSILADAVEAIVGAVYIDGGAAAADALVRRLLHDVDIAQLHDAGAKDAKTALQEWLQARKMGLPQYEVLRSWGAEHAQTFEVACRVAERQLQTLGQGRSHRKAEQAAAAAMLALLQKETAS